MLNSLLVSGAYYRAQCLGETGHGFVGSGYTLGMTYCETMLKGKGSYDNELISALTLPTVNEAYIL
jgi:hypothetical protein